MKNFKYLGLAAPLLLLAACGQMESPEPTLAVLDIVSNNVTVDGTDTIIEKGSTIVAYKIDVEGKGVDGQGGCNASDSTPAIVTITAPVGITVSGSTLLDNRLRFVKCDSFQNVTFSTGTAGSYAITHSVTDAGSTSTVGTYTNNANWMLKVNKPAPSDTTPPVIESEVTGTLGNNG